MNAKYLRLAPALLFLAIALGFRPAGAAESASDAQSDPLEKLNRGVFKLNEWLDKAIEKPLARAYKAVLPQPVRTGVANLFGNLESPMVILNDLLQGKLDQGLSDTERLVFNSTFGIAGIFDVATLMHLPRHEEDFGQTLGVWGVGPGWYLVVPLFGSGTVRDAIGWIPDGLVDPIYQLPQVSVRNILYGAKIVDIRSRIPAAAEEALKASMDPYVFARSAYLQRRLNLVYDGHPPRTALPEDEGPEQPKSKTPGGSGR
jgi:phospholipid-binding lipoprotein MlaA